MYVTFLSKVPMPKLEEQMKKMNKQRKRQQRRHLNGRNQISEVGQIKWSRDAANQVAPFVIAQFVSGSHQSRQRLLVSELISRALCAVDTSHHPFQLPLQRQANFSQLPLPEEKWKHTVASLCGIEVLCICMKTNYF